MRVKAGSRFKVSQRLPVTGMAGGDSKIAETFEGYLEAGEVVLCTGDMPFGATAFYCVPDNREEFERRYVPQSVKQYDTYKGIFAVLLPVALIGNGLAEIGGSNNTTKRQEDPAE